MSLKLLVKLYCFVDEIPSFFWHMTPHLVRKTQCLIHRDLESLIDGVNCMTEFKSNIQAALENLISDISILADYAALAVSVVKFLLIL